MQRSLPAINADHFMTTFQEDLCNGSADALRRSGY
jgi:hypothetical protein